MIKVFDDILPQQVFDNLQNNIVGDNFNVPFFYSNSTAVGKQNEVRVNNYGFSHLAYDNGQTNSYLGKLLEVSILHMLDKTNINVKDIMRIRIGLLTYVGRQVINDPHVDFEKEHYTGLLYLNDSDGDTFIYNQKYDPSTNLLMQEYFNTFLNGHLSVKETISPKQNRLVIFDGHYFHSSSTPTIVPARYVVNFNFTIW